MANTYQLDIKRINSNDADYKIAERLLVNSFDENERRDSETERLLTDSSPIFSFNKILLNSDCVGLITTWNFGKCLYVEHFAIAESVRGLGIGGLTLAKLIELSKLPIILEVELPDSSPHAPRRVAFYERHGFSKWNVPYVQPPYATNKKSIPMMLMAHNLIETEDCTNIVMALLYRHVYRTKWSKQDDL